MTRMARVRAATVAIRSCDGLSVGRSKEKGQRVGGSYVGANDGGDDGCGDDDAAYAETGEDEETPGSVERVGL